MAVRTGLSALVASLLAFAAGAQAEIRLVDDEGATLVLPAPAP